MQNVKETLSYWGYSTMATALGLRTQGTSTVATQCFFSILTKNSKDFSIVQKTFETYLKPLYGDQTSSLNKIQNGRDRTCELMYAGRDNPVGLLVYKSNPQDEFKEFEIKNSLEVKTLMVLNPKENSGKGYGTKLVERAETVAQRKAAESMHLTVSENAKDSLAFFKKKGFQQVTVWPGKYLQNVNEYLFKYPIKQEEHKTEEVESLTMERKPPLRQGRDSHLKKRKIEDISASEKKIEEEEAKRIKTQADTARGSATGKRKREEGEEEGSATRRKTEHSQAAKVHQITLRKQYIHLIRDGSKTVEGRINSGMMLRLRTGDHVRFFYQQNPKDDVTCKITNITTHKSFREMLEQSGFKKCIPEAQSLDAAVQIYNQIRGYPERAQKSGVLAVYLQVIKNS